MGFYVFFLRKYISYVLTIRGGRRYSVVGVSMCPSRYMDLTAWVNSSATCLVSSTFAFVCHSMKFSMFEGLGMRLDTSKCSLSVISMYYNASMFYTVL